MNLKISGRLILGFGVMSLILMAAIGITINQVSKINNISERFIALRLLTANSSAAMVNNANASLAALRGYMLTGAPQLKNDRAEVWANFDRSTNILEIAGSRGGSINKIARGSLQVAEASMATSLDVEAIAAATTELSSSIQEISQQVATSSQIANSAQSYGYSIKVLWAATDLDEPAKIMQTDRSEYLGNLRK
jgi:methyl-accepting chemotaxis protein